MILAAEWIFPVTSPPFRWGEIDIDNGSIRNIRRLRESDVPDRGICLLPGLVNVHSHLAYTGLRNRFDHLDFFPWIRKLTEVKYQDLTEEEIQISTRLGIDECLRAGITTVADMSDLEVSLQVLSTSPLNAIFYWEVFGVETEQAEQSWKDLQKNFPRFQQEYSTAKLKIGVSPHACYTVRPELFSRIADWAVKEQIPVSFHLAESKAEEEFITNHSGVIHDFLLNRAGDWKISGNTSILHLEHTGIFHTAPLLAHLVQVGSDDLEILKKYNVTVAHCPKSNAKFGHGIAPVFEMLEKGFIVGIGTDSAASNNRLDLFEEARFSLLQQRCKAGKMVMNEQQMLEMITIRGAEALGMQKKIGSLESGKQADVIAVQIPSYYQDEQQVLNHLIHNTTASDVLKTFISGKEVFSCEQRNE